MHHEVADRARVGREDGSAVSGLVEKAFFHAVCVGGNEVDRDFLLGAELDQFLFETVGDGGGRPAHAITRIDLLDRFGGNPIQLQVLFESRCVERLDIDRKSTRLNSSHLGISYAVFCLKKKKKRMN